MNIILSFTIFNKAKLSKTFLLFFCFLSLFLEAQKNLQAIGKLEFSENKSQWNNNVLFRSDIPYGALFLENNCFTFNFVNPADVELSIAHSNGKAVHQTGIIHLHSYKVLFLNSNTNTHFEGLKPTSDYSNYFIGNNPSKWASHVRKFKVVRYKNIYNNIDMDVYSIGNNMKYNFIIYPGGNPDDISLSYEGLSDINLKDDNLILTTTINTITELKPYSHYDINTNHKTLTTTNEQQTTNIDCRFILKDNVISFSVDEYNKSKTLIIDPQLIFSTYSGSIADNWGFTATFDNDNNVFSGGIAFGVGYPVSLGAFQQTFGGGDTASGTGQEYYGEDIAIIKYDSTGRNRLWATYLGGKSSDLPHSMIANSANELLIFGTTGSDNFPVTPNAYSKTFKGGTSIIYDGVIYFKHGIDLFISKLSPDGSSLLASTYMGGTGNDGFNFKTADINYLMQGDDSLYFNYGDGARGEIITDNLDNVYVGTCTFSGDFPVTSSAFQQKSGGKEDGVVFKMNNDLSSLIWSSYLGGSGNDAIYSLDIDKKYNLFVAGGTNSADFPTTANAYKKNYLGGSADGFVAHISGDGTKLMGCTYFGSNDYDQAYFVKTDRQNYPYITGQTRAYDSTLIYKAAYSIPNSGQFIAKLTPQLDTIVWSTVFGTGNGKPNISISAFTVDICNKIYLAGWGREWPFFESNTWDNIEGTKNMQVTPDAYQSQTDGQDFYVMVLSDNASSLYYATFFGELQYTDCYYSGRDHVDGGTSRFDKKGSIYESACASCGSCQHFPTYPNPGAWSNTDNSFNCNNAVFKINIVNGIVLANFDNNIKDCNPTTVDFTNNSTGKSFRWDFGDSTYSTEKSPTHTYKHSRTYSVTLVAIDSSTCNVSDTLIKQITLPAILSVKITDSTNIQCKNLCTGAAAALASGGNSPYIYNWSGGQTGTVVSNLCVGNYFVTATDNKGCTALASVNIINLTDFTIRKDTTVMTCFGKCLGKASLNIIGGIKPYRYLWDDGQTDTIAINLCAGEHNVTVTESQGYKCTLSLNIGQFPKIIASLINLDSNFCFGNCDVTKKVIVNSGSPPYFYYWNNKAGYDTLQHLCAGTYTLTIIDKHNCNLDTNTSVTAPPPISVSISSTRVPCVKACNARIEADASGGTSPYSYLWYNDNTYNVIIDQCIGFYTVTVTDNNLCRAYKTIDVIDSSYFPSIVLKAEHDTVVHGGFTILHIIPTDESWSYSWQPSESLNSNTSPNPVVTPQNNMYYYVTITDKYGCIFRDSIQIFIKEAICNEPYIFIPNAFTPDESKNNILYVRSNMLESMHLLIYNRWGEKVFESYNITDGWDGTYKGSKCSPGVFDYYIDATCYDKQTYKHKGNITLIR